MAEEKTVHPYSKTNIVTVDGATYIVTSCYAGKISLLDLIKQMIRRDLEKQLRED